MVIIYDSHQQRRIFLHDYMICSFSEEGERNEQIGKVRHDYEVVVKFLDLNQLSYGLK